MNQKKQILLTNDDGIQSPALWATAQALAELGDVTVVAPREQASGSGRSFPSHMDGRIQTLKRNIGGQERPVYTVGGTPSQVVLHAVLEILSFKPDLVVSGINYGENMGNSITISGTVGAAMDAATLDIPAMAISLQTSPEHYLSLSDEIDFSTSAYFTRLFASQILQKGLPQGVDLLNINIPDGATPQTPWQMTRLARHRYFTPWINRKGTWDEPGCVDIYLDVKEHEIQPDTDIYTVVFKRQISVTPVTLDMTARADLVELEQRYR